MFSETNFYSDLGRILDVSTVRTDVTMSEIDQMIDIVRKYNCICASPMPWATRYTLDKLADCHNTVVTGVVGFPGGAETTHIKVCTANELLAMGCKELDMLINVSALKSGKYEYVTNDVRAVVEAAGNIPVKTILEICYLTDDEIMKASELCVSAGAAYIKTGTGWGPKPTTVETVKLIRSVIGNSAKIKAAGGVKNLETIEQMVEAGCDRFGIGVRTANIIFGQVENKINR